MKISFPYALPLFLAVSSERFALELTEQIDDALLIDKLNSQAPKGLVFLAAKKTDTRSFQLQEDCSYLLEIKESEALLWRDAVTGILAVPGPESEKIKDFSLEGRFLRLNTRSPFNPMKFAATVSSRLNTTLYLGEIRKT